MTTATAFLLMALVYALVDAYNKWDGEPFIYAGMMPLSIYKYNILNTGCLISYWFCFQISL